TYPWTSAPAFPPQHVTQSSLLLLTGFLKQPTSSPYPTLHRIPLGYHVGWWPSVYLLGVKRFFFFGFHSSWYSCQFFSLSTLVLCLLSLPICLCAFVWLPHLSNAGSSWSPPSGLAHLWQSTDLRTIFCVLHCGHDVRCIL
uniref:Uncharacterized protein n=2 Tax=Haplochromini TaxID=319058 RepID=A0A3P9D176_9CICH